MCNGEEKGERGARKERNVITSPITSIQFPCKAKKHKGRYFRNIPNTIYRIFKPFKTPTGKSEQIHIVSVAPTTLSTGVVMTTVARGNTAHALLVSLLSNAFSVAGVPLTLPLLLGGWTGHAAISMDRSALILKIGALVLAPLFPGVVLKLFMDGYLVGKY